MAPSNVSVLTQSATVYAKKKRAKKDEIKEVVFDDEARREFLTGFRKRKLQRTEEKKSKRKEREKQERLESRREQRKILAEQAVDNAAKVEAAYGGDVLEADEDEDWQGTSRTDKGKGKEEEYEDEEQLATVTVVEDFDPEDLMDGSDTEGQPKPHHPAPVDPKHKKRDTATTGTAKRPRKLTPKKVHYETKAARTLERKKQNGRKLEKAARAGGKGSRKVNKTKVVKKR